MNPLPRIRWRYALLAALIASAAIEARAQPALDAARFEAALRASRSPHAEPIRAFYTARAYRPVWTRGAQLSAFGLAFHTALGEVENDGLDPRAYAVPVPAEGRSLEAVEVAFADALLRVTDDLARGRVDPARVYRDWEATRRHLDAERLLGLAASRGPAVALQSARPPHAGYARLRAALARYRSLAEAGGWPSVPPGPTLRPGDEHPSVPILRARLFATGDLNRAAPPGSPEGYDAVLERAVRHAQARLGLEVDGVVGPATRAALNVTAGERVEQIILSLERWRWLPAELGATHVLINAAGMTLDLVEGEEQVMALRTIVGTRSNPTPGFSSVITDAVFSPYWYVPESIARAEIRPRLASDPGYLARHHMRVLPGGQIRQDPGPSNPLGPVKFIFENRFGVRLHGTSNPALFDEHVRAFSHGCIRVEDPLRLAIQLVRSSAWDEAHVRAVVDRREENRVRLPEPVPIHVSYWTAWVEDDGTVQFRDDLYGRDRALAHALDGLSDAGASGAGGLAQRAASGPLGCETDGF